MRFALTSAAPAAFLFAVQVATAQEPRPAPPQIVTTGQGEVRVAPDRATVNIGVQTRAPTVAAATTENNQKQRLVIDAIKAKGVPPELITTSQFSVQPETQFDRTGQNPPKVIGYIVSNAVIVEVRRLDLVGPVLDAALGAGANQIHSLSYSIARPDSARRAAIAQAVAQAKADADVAARAAGGSLGALIELSTSGERPQARSFARMEAFVVTGAAESVPVEAGLEVVRATVTTRWVYVPR